MCGRVADGWLRTAPDTPLRNRTTSSRERCRIRAGTSDEFRMPDPPDGWSTHRPSQKNAPGSRKRYSETAENRVATLGRNAVRRRFPARTEGEDVWLSDLKPAGMPAFYRGGLGNASSRRSASGGPRHSAKARRNSVAASEVTPPSPALPAPGSDADPALPAHAQLVARIGEVAVAESVVRPTGEGR
jgi:hypothetical protein